MRLGHFDATPQPYLNITWAQSACTASNQALNRQASNQVSEQLASAL
jgi:hypothetical protein